MTQACDFIILDVPFPPSSNAATRVHLINGRASMGRSKKYEQYIKTFGNFWMLVRTGGKIDLGQDILLWCIVCPPRAGTDSHNYTKVLLDCLEMSGAFPDDKMVVSTHIEKGPRVRGGLMRCYLANEKRRAELTRRYFEDFEREWFPRRDGVILDCPRSLFLERL